MPDKKDDDRGIEPRGKPCIAPMANESQTERHSSPVPDRYHSAPAEKRRQQEEAAILRAIEKHKADFLEHLERRKILVTMHKKMDVIESLQDRVINMIETCHRPESGEGLANMTLHSPSPDPDMTEVTTRNERTVHTGSPPTSPSLNSVDKDNALKGLQTTLTTKNPLVKYADQNVTSNTTTVPLQIIGQKMKNTNTSHTSMITSTSTQERSSENLDSWQQRGGTHGIQSLIDIKKKLNDANMSPKVPVYIEEKVEIQHRMMNLEIKGKAPENKLIPPPGPPPKIKAAQRKKERREEIKCRYQNVNCIERDKEYYPLVKSYGSDRSSKVLPDYKKIPDQKNLTTKVTEPTADYTGFANDKLPPIHRQNDIENQRRKEKLHPSILSNSLQNDHHNLTAICREKEVRNLASQKLAPTIQTCYNQKTAKNLTLPVTHNFHQKVEKKSMLNSAAHQKSEHLTNTRLPPINNLDNRYSSDNRLFLKGRTLPSLDSQPKKLHDFYEKNVGVADGYCLRIPKPPHKEKVEAGTPLNGLSKLPPIVKEKIRNGSRRKQR